MRFQRTLEYDASPDDVFAMLSDPAFREKAARAQGVVSVEVTVVPQAHGVSIEVDTVQDTAGLPAVARRIAGATTRAVVREEWASPTGGSIEITAPGRPVRVEGTVSLEPAGSGTRHVLDLDVEVKVPLVGGRLEQVMADNIDQGLRVEHTVGRAWLEGER